MTQNKNGLASPQLIDNQSSYETVLSELMKERILAVDTEANSLYAYREQVCLIQISSPRMDYILDPLRINNISSLGNLFRDPKIEKVFHASEYDFLILHEEYQFEFQNLFDTMLAAQILGRTKLGLDALLEELVGITVNKKYQRADWGKRPLSEDMLRYAQMDTHYLIKIRHELAADLEKTGLSPIAREDFSLACLVHKVVREKKDDPCWRINGARKLPPQQAAVLVKLFQYRDQVARNKDQPVFKIMSSKALLQLAEECPANKKQLLKLDLPGKKAVERHGDNLIKAIQAGLDSAPVYPPKRERVDDSYLTREKALRNWRKSAAQKMNVNSAVILPRELLYAVVSANPSNKKDLAAVLENVPWRLERFGDDILSVLIQSNQSGSKG